MIVKTYREKSGTKEIEIQIHSIYAKLWSNGRRTCDNGVERSYIDSDNKDDDIEDVDGFAGEIDINAAPCVGVFKIYRPVAY